jgi:hypothetical protein
MYDDKTGLKVKDMDGRLRTVSLMRNLFSSRGDFFPLKWPAWGKRTNPGVCSGASAPSGWR